MAGARPDHPPVSVPEDSGLLSETADRELADQAERFAQDVRERMNEDAVVDPAELFAHVYAEPTRALTQQRAALLSELEGYSS